MRALPVGTLAGIAGLSLAWSLGSRLNSGTERSMLIGLGTVGLSMVFGDHARAVTAPSPTALRIRRRVAGALGITLVFFSWIIARFAAASMFDVTAAPGRWELFELVVVASSQLALGAMLARRSDATSIGPGLLVAMAWMFLGGAPRIQERLYDVGDHPWTWMALLAGFALMTAAASTDPARRWVTFMTDRITMR